MISSSQYANETQLSRHYQIVNRKIVLIHCIIEPAHLLVAYGIKHLL